MRRYVSLLSQTAKILKLHKPKVLITQNPSIVLTGFACLFKHRHKYKLVVDAHNEAVEPYIFDYMGMRALAKFLMRSADLTIVTNRQLAKRVDNAGGRSFVLPDKIPAAGRWGKKELSEKFNVVLIATFAKDEPIRLILQAATEFAERMNLYVTGNAEALDPRERRRLAPSIIFTGYLADTDYWTLLNSASAIIDLTEMANCLVCGAYEGVAVGKPLILSDSDATREHFRRGVLYTESSVIDIKEAFNTMIKEHASLKREVVNLRNELTMEWEQSAKGLKENLKGLENPIRMA